MISRRTFLAGTAAFGLTPIHSAFAESFGNGGKKITIGYLEDMSGPYRDLTGPTGLQCARLAVKEFIDANPQYQIELLSADHQNKADIGSSIAREWYDRNGVDVIVGVGNTPVAIAVNSVTEQKDKVHLNTAGASSELTGKYCSQNMVHWTFDTWCTSSSTARKLVAQGKDTWYIIRADYTFGATLANETQSFVEAAGGKVIGSAAYPFPGTTDFSSFLLSAQASGAKVVAFASAGDDTNNLMKQAKEFGVDKTSTLAGLSVFINNVLALGVPASQGLVMTTTFYWDLNDRTRAFTKRVQPTIGNTVPNRNQAGNYSAIVHYLKVVKDMGGVSRDTSGRSIVAAMKQKKTDDDCFGQGYIRADGRKMHPSYLMQVKTPAQSINKFDVFNVLATTPAEQAFRPMSEGKCGFITHA